MDLNWEMFDWMIRLLDPLPTDRAFWILVSDDVDNLFHTSSYLEENHPKHYLILLATDQSPGYNEGTDFSYILYPLLTNMLRRPEIKNKHNRDSPTA